MAIDPIKVICSGETVTTQTASPFSLDDLRRYADSWAKSSASGEAFAIVKLTPLSDNRDTQAHTEAFDTLDAFQARWGELQADPSPYVYLAAYQNGFRLGDEIYNPPKLQPISVTKTHTPIWPGLVGAGVAVAFFFALGRKHKGHS